MKCCLCLPTHFLPVSCCVLGFRRTVLFVKRPFNWYFPSAFQYFICRFLVTTHNSSFDHIRNSIGVRSCLIKLSKWFQTIIDCMIVPKYRLYSNYQAYSLWRRPANALISHVPIARYCSFFHAFLLTRLLFSTFLETQGSFLLIVL